MPITQSAKKAWRGSDRKKVYNDRRKKTLKVAIKAAKKPVVAGERADQLAAAYRAIDKAAKRGVIKKNTAARKKSRLVKAVKKLV